MSAAGRIRRTVAARMPDDWKKRIRTASRRAVGTLPTPVSSRVRAVVRRAEAKTAAGGAPGRPDPLELGVERSQAKLVRGASGRAAAAVAGDAQAHERLDTALLGPSHGLVRVEGRRAVAAIAADDAVAALTAAGCSVERLQPGRSGAQVARAEVLVLDLAGFAGVWSGALSAYGVGLLREVVDAVEAARRLGITTWLVDRGSAHGELGAAALRRRPDVEVIAPGSPVDAFHFTEDPGDAPRGLADVLASLDGPDEAADEPAPLTAAQAPSTTGRPDTAEGVSVLLYGDVNLNVMDGSAVWLVSMARTWSLTGASVDVVLKARESTDRLSGELRRIDGVRVVDADPAAGADEMPPKRAVEVLAGLDSARQYDVVMIRGIRVCERAAAVGSFDGRLWSYITEYDYPTALDADPRRWQAISAAAAGSRFMLAQTEEARAVLEAAAPAAAGRTALLLPMIPDDLGASTPAAVDDGVLRLVYTGKFARRWLTDRMPEIVVELRAAGADAELTMVGDKVQRDPEVREWPERMREVMAAELPGVRWAGGVSRAESLRIAAGADLTLSWRDPELDLSVELSTKVLESCALGVPPVLNRTRAHEELLGEDYPLFVSGDDSPADVAATIAAARRALPQLSERVRAAADRHRESARAESLLDDLARVGLIGGAARTSTPAEKTKVVVAGHDLKFAGELIDMLSDHPGIELRIDHWDTLHNNNPLVSAQMASWADIVVCEWAGPNAVWYSQHKRPGQKLIVRLHMFELRGGWLRDIRTEAVDRFVAVSDLYRDLIVEHLDVPAERITVIPNAVDIADLARPGLPGREHRLGLVGIVPLRKRLDRAVDLLRLLREEDDRFTLHIRGRMPWEIGHEWAKPSQREAYLDLFSALGRSDLRDVVAFEPFGADMAGWLRKIGWVLSPSSAESFHLAPAEGMAAGAVPVIWERPGARGVFGDDFLVDGAESAARRILDATASGTWADEARTAAAQAVRFDAGTVADTWEKVLFSA